jgi:YesN/AraC family two-component response regulator
MSGDIGRLSNKPTVLVIDDDVSTLTTFAEMLRLDGFNVCIAATGQCGLQLLEQQPFDLAVVDIRLPDLDGVALLRTVRAAGILVPFVFVTGFGTISSAVEAIQLGARNYFEKPLVGEEFLRSVRSSLVAPTSCERSATEAAALPASEPRVAQALSLIEQRFADPALSGRSLASELGMSTEHLCRLVKQHAEKSIGSYVNATRIRHAQRLLRDTILTAKEIATQVGYQRTSQFDRYFRRLCGFTPTEYRRAAHGHESQ